MVQGPGAGYEDALVIDDASSEQSLEQARALLERSEGMVILDGRIALRPGPDAMHCEVIDPEPESHRCAEEFKVMVENASRRLAASKLASRLPRRPIRWLVVEDRGTETVELWAAPSGVQAAPGWRQKGDPMAS